MENKLKNILLTIFSILIQSAQLFAQHEVNWISIEEAEKLNKENPKPFLVDIYTDWCGWCKRLDATTYKDPQIVTFLNQNFYAVKFNAETRDTIIYQGKTYTNRGGSTRGTHDLAFVFMPQSRSYPTTYFMDSNMQRNLVVPGYLKSNEMAAFLVYYHEQLYNAANINEFRTLFDKAFDPSQQQKKSQIKWKNMNQALASNTTEKKKIMVFLNDGNSIASRIMEGTNFKDSLLTDYINKNYLAVNFDIRTNDTITIQNQQLVNLPTDGELHQLAIAGFRGGEIKFPAILFFDENNLLITPVPQYMTPEFMMPVLVYFKEDKYKDTEFPVFLKEYQSKNTN